MTDIASKGIKGRDVHPQGGKAVVVFGGAGFIGSHLLRRLAAEGLGPLYCVDIRKPKIQVDGVRYLHGDVRDLSDFKVAEPVGVIYNFAAVHTTPGHPTHEYYETNVEGATEVTSYARRAHVDTVVFTSSISIYGPGEDTKTEDTPPAPESAYGWSKWLAEGIHRSWKSESAKRRLVIARPAVIFGHAEGGNFTRMAKLMRGGIFVYPGRKDTIKACFYVEDLLDALFYAQSLRQPYILFNAAYPDHYTIEAIVKAFKSRYFTRTRELLVPRWVVMSAARLLRPFAFLNLGIHPDRVLKLVKSTDVLPLWLMNKGAVKHGMLPSAIERWHADTMGTFDVRGVAHVAELRLAKQGQAEFAHKAHQAADMQPRGAIGEGAAAGPLMIMDKANAGKGHDAEAGAPDANAEIDVFHIEEEGFVHAAKPVEKRRAGKKSAA